MFSSVWKEILDSRQIAFILLLPSLIAANPYCTAMQEWIQRITSDSNAVEVTHWKGIRVELQYGDTLGENLYCGESRAFLHKDAASKLAVALKILEKEHPGYELVIWDAARPLYTQQALWMQVRGTPQTAYVSNPRKGSLHNFGMALDIAARKPDGEHVDMGSVFDEFSPKASASRKTQDSLVAEGVLTPRQRANRQIFTQIMRRAGFIQLPSEWWHFNAARAQWVRDNMKFLGD